MAKKAFVYDGTQWVDIAQSTTDLSAYAPVANPTLTGTVTAPKIALTDTTDASLSSTGNAIQIGTTSSVNLVVDNNEIQVRNNGVASSLFINNDGGNVGINNTVGASGDLVIGNATGSNSLIVNGNLEATGQIQSSIATGTAPFTVASTTLVTNLNADLLDGLSATTANTASTVVARDSNRNINADSANFVRGGAVTITPVANTLTSGNVSWGVTMPSSPMIAVGANSGSAATQWASYSSPTTTGCTVWVLRTNTTATTVSAVAVSI